MKTSCDVIVVGAGIVGATLAAALQREGFTVAVIDRRAPVLNWPPESLDARVSAMTRASENIFRHLGVWEEMAASAGVFRKMTVWEAAPGGELHFDASEIAADALGHIVENRVITRALHRLLAQHGEQVQCRYDVDILALRRSADRVTVILSNGDELTAPLLVGADGKDSGVRERCGISTVGWHYAQRALVANVRPERFHEETAWQRFLAGGPLAFLPLREGLCTIVWSSPAEAVRRLEALPAREFAAELGEAFEHRLGRIVAVGPRASFALRFQLARRVVARRVALIGDAAHTVHPLAGQGANLGLVDAAVLAETLAAARSQGGDFGADAVLRRYERRRKPDVLLFSAVIDGVKRVFSFDPPGFAGLRRLGVTAVHRLTPLNHLLMRRAMGLAGDLPALAR